MRNLLALVSLCGILSFVAGCASPDAPVFGTLYTGNVRGSVGGVDNNVKTTKTGVSLSTGILGIATGDSSITAAMRAGNINKVHHIDSESFSILGVYSTYKTVVHGE